jgi:hypothetical protein
MIKLDLFSLFVKSSSTLIFHVYLVRVQSQYTRIRQAVLVVVLVYTSLPVLVLVRVLLLSCSVTVRIEERGKKQYSSTLSAVGTLAS